MKGKNLKLKNVLSIKILILISSLFISLAFALSSTQVTQQKFQDVRLQDFLRVLLELYIKNGNLQSSPQVTISAPTLVSPILVSPTSASPTPVVIYPSETLPTPDFEVFRWNELNISSISRNVGRLRLTEPDVIAVLTAYQKVFSAPPATLCPEKSSPYFDDSTMKSTHIFCPPLEKAEERIEEFTIKVFKDTIFLFSWTKNRGSLNKLKVGDKIEVYGFQTGEKEIEALIVRVVYDKPVSLRPLPFPKRTPLPTVPIPSPIVPQPVPEFPVPNVPRDDSSLLPNFVIRNFDVRNNPNYPNSSYDVYFKVRNTGADYKASRRGEVVKASIFVNNMFLNDLNLFSELKAGEEKEIRQTFLKRRSNEPYCKPPTNLRQGTTTHPIVAIDMLRVVVNPKVADRLLTPETDYSDNEARMEFPRNIICGEFSSESSNLPDFVITMADVTRNKENPISNFDISMSIFNNSLNDYLSPVLNKSIKATIWAGEVDKKTFPVFVDLIDTGITELKAQETKSVFKSLIKKQRWSSLCNLKGDKVNFQVRINPNERRNDYVFQESNFLNNAYVLTVPKFLVCEGQVEL